MKKAFTIAETITAMVILAVSLSAIITAIREANSAIAFSSRRLEAVYFAESLIVKEKISSERTYKTYTGKHQDYDYTVKISPTAITSLGRVDVIVSWLNQGVKKKITLCTFINFPVVIQQQS